jgi:hypothetical protein
MTEPKDLEALLILLRRYGVVHFAGAVEVDFTCPRCFSDEVVETPKARVVDFKAVAEEGDEGTDDAQ